MQLIIGNKNYSSWSMRAWLLMTHAGIAFQEVKLRLSLDEASPFKQFVAQHSPAGRVPVLIDDGFAVWDTLAIAEYLVEKFPALHLWPVAPLQRARARSLCAEMHAGFAALRNHCGMNIEASLPEIGSRLMSEQADVRRDLQRIDQMWCEQLERTGGPFLFGDFSIADAFYAPVCTRIRTYALPVSAASQAYAERMFALPAMKSWIADALDEHDFIAEDEPYRTAGTAS
jgi:glutathione S-transferase